MYKRFKKLLIRFDDWMHYDPPGAMSATGWRLFREEFKEVAPIRYWTNDIFKKTIVWPVSRRYNDIARWTRYRTTHRYHIVKTGLGPGYHEIETLMLHTNFNMLKKFVETETAAHAYNRETTWCERHMPFYRIFFPFRRPDLGLAYLDWASTLDDPSLPLHERSEGQAKTARETRILYKWWIEGRPSRKKIDVVLYKNQGKGSIDSLDDAFDRNADDYKAYVESVTKSNAQDCDFRSEDQEMLERLIKIRQSLWT